MNTYWTQLFANKNAFKQNYKQKINYILEKIKHVRFRRAQKYIYCVFKLLNSLHKEHKQSLCFLLVFQSITVTKLVDKQQMRNFNDINLLKNTFGCLATSQRFSPNFIITAGSPLFFIFTRFNTERPLLQNETIKINQPGEEFHQIIASLHQPAN